MFIFIDWKKYINNYCPSTSKSRHCKKTHLLKNGWVSKQIPLSQYSLTDSVTKWKVILVNDMVKCVATKIWFVRILLCIVHGLTILNSIIILKCILRTTWHWKIINLARFYCLLCQNIRAIQPCWFYLSKVDGNCF